MPLLTSMTTLTNIAWILLSVESCFLVAWVLFAVRTVGRDPQERVVTTIFTGLAIALVCLAGGLLSYGQARQKNTLIWLGIVLTSLPAIGLIAAMGREGTLRLRARQRTNHENASNGFQDSRMTAMVAAIDRHDETEFKALLAPTPPDWTARNGHGRTLLGHAIHRATTDYLPRDNVRSIELLVEAGARVGSNDLNSRMTVMEEVLSANTPCALALLEWVLKAGGNPNATDANNEPLVHLMECTCPKLQVLARHGANLQVLSQRKDRPGWTTLMTAVAMSDWDKALFLMEHGVSPDYRAPDGNTVESLLKEVAKLSTASGSIPKPGFQRVSDRLKLGR